MLEGCALAQRAEHNQADASVLQQPCGVAGKEFVIDLKVFVERGSSGGHYAKPVHREISCGSRIETLSCDGAEHNAAIGIGNTGGRTEALRHPKSASSAGPQIRPWQGPMPQRVCSFASVQPRRGTSA